MRRSPVGVEQKPLHDQDVNAFTVILIAWKDLEFSVLLTPWDRSNLTGFCCQAWMGAHHGVHVQSADDCGGNDAKVSGAEHQTCINTHANPWIRARLTIYCLKPSSPTSISSWGWNIHQWDALQNTVHPPTAKHLTHIRDQSFWLYWPWEVILVDHTAVGQVLGQSVGQGCFASVRDPAGRKHTRHVFIFKFAWFYSGVGLWRWGHFPTG